MICEKCGSYEGVKEVLDPVAYEIAGKEVWKDLCDDCYSEVGYDI